MPINIQTREEINARSMVAPENTTTAGLTLRAISLGSMELLHAINNPLATGDSDQDIDTHTLAEFIWIHAAPLDEVIGTVYDTPSQVAKKVTQFCMSISPDDIKKVAASLAVDRAAVIAASARPADEGDRSPNVPARP